MEKLQWWRERQKGKHKCSLLSSHWPSGERGVDLGEGNAWQIWKVTEESIQVSYVGYKGESSHSAEGCEKAQ